MGTKKYGKPRQIAIILPDILQSTGLRSLLIDYFSPVEIEAFDSFKSFSLVDKEVFDYYFTLPEIIVLYADFFMLKRNKIIPLVFSSENTDNTSAHNHLIINTTQESIIEQLRELIVKKASPMMDATELNGELSTREIEVLQLIVSGITNKEVADRLCISLNTVLTHRKNITTKLGIKTIPGLTFYAITNGIISGDEIEL